ncbi:MAG: hypothetical protein H6709_21755 [Kofleriaceae bacterium]|nr:hypothetical protein [Kofleriaceae bacterium]MCB9574711.1 hypothetical protein [Kofleriaceae bacterium]
MVTPRAAVVAVAVVAVVGAGATPARAGELTFLGPAREISHSSSASRDTALPALQLGPHRVLTGGAEAALAALPAGGVTWRLGFFGMLELESEGETTAWAPFPQADIRFWRGHYGYAVAASLDRLAARWCDGCAVEATLSARHESEHYTGANDGGPGTDYSDRPHVGNYLMLDVAARRPLGAVELTARVQYRQFLPGQSGWAEAPGADLIARWRRWPRLHPFGSAFGEYAFGTRGFPDAYRVRVLIGVMLPSPRGDLQLYVSGDVGHRQGLAVFTEERALGGGVRLAFW